MTASELSEHIRSRFVDVTLTPQASACRVGGVGRRAGEIGDQVAIIGLKHGGGYEIVLRFADGRLDSFTPHDLFPA